MKEAMTTLMKVLVLCSFLGLLLFPHSGWAAVVYLQTAGAQNRAVVGSDDQSGANHAQLTVLAFDPITGNPISNLGGTLGGGPLPAGWSFKVQGGPNSGPPNNVTCGFIVEFFRNEATSTAPIGGGPGIYSITVNPTGSGTLCPAWRVGDYVYSFEVDPSAGGAGFQGKALGVLEIR